MAVKLVEHLCQDMEEEGIEGSCVTLKLKSTDFRVRTTPLPAMLMLLLPFHTLFKTLFITCPWYGVEASVCTALLVQQCPRFEACATHVCIALEF
eukprot:1157219-Pelagomonas_calceolata.AAC.4